METRKNPYLDQSMSRKRPFGLMVYRVLSSANRPMTSDQIVAQIKRERGSRTVTQGFGDGIMRAAYDMAKSDKTISHVGFTPSGSPLYSIDPRNTVVFVASVVRAYSHYCTIISRDQAVNSRTRSGGRI